MGIAERKQREKEARIELIQKSASRLFNKKGFDKTSMEDIAKEAEIAAGTIYLHFKGKEDLFYSLFIPFSERQKERLNKLTKEKKKPADRVLEQITKVLYDSYMEAPDLFKFIWAYDAKRFHAIMSKQSQNQLQHLMKWHVKEIEKIVARGMTQGIFIQVDTKITSILIWNLLVGIFQWEQNRKFARGQDYLKSTIESAVDFILRSLKPR